MKRSFSILEALRAGWELTKNNYLLIVGAMVIPSLFSFVPSILGYFLESNAGSTQAVLALSQALPFLSLGSSLLSSYVGFGANLIYLKLIDQHPARLSDMFSAGKLFIYFILTGLAYGFIVLIGLVLLVVPGIIWGIRFQFFQFAILDKKVGPTEALKISSQITEGVKMNLFLFGLVMMLVNLGGLLLFGVGLLATIPLTTMAYVYVYRQLLTQTESPSTPNTT